MNDQRLKLLAIHSLTIMLVVIVIAIAVSPSNQRKIYADENDKSADKNTQLEVEVISDGIMSKDELKSNILGDKYLIIKKDEKSLFPVEVLDYYMDRSIEITVKGLKDKSFRLCKELPY